MKSISGTDFLSTLPPLESIFDFDDLGDLRENTTFQYLLKFGYEYFSKL